MSTPRADSARFTLNPPQPKAFFVGVGGCFELKIQGYTRATVVVGVGFPHFRSKRLWGGHARWSAFGKNRLKAENL
jgi:hypothetical protein